MGRDKYSNSHTIEIINDSEDLTLKTNSGDISVTSGGNTSIYALSTCDLTAFNVNLEAFGTLTLEAESLTTAVAGDIGITSTSGDIKIEAPDGDIRVMAEKELVLTANWIPNPSYFDEGDIYMRAEQNAHIRSTRYLALASNAVLISSQGVDSTLGTSTIDEHDIVIDSEDDLVLKADHKVRVDDTQKIEFEVSEDILLEAGTDISLTAQGGDILLQPGLEKKIYLNDSVKVQGDLEITGELNVDNLTGDWNDNLFNTFSSYRISAKTGSSAQTPGMLEIWGQPNGNGQGTISYSDAPERQYVLRVVNRNVNGQTDGIDINLNGFNIAGTPKSSNNWMQFRWGGKICGAIQGADKEADNLIYGPWGYYGWSTTEKQGVATKHSIANNSALTGLTAQTSPGNAQYVSGLADFGEFFEAGNLSEWDESWRQSSSAKHIVGLPEGIVVWVIGDQFFKDPQDGLGVPMLITKRALMVGSGAALLKSSGDERVGEVLSFIGKLPILVKGAIGIGDLIVPLEGDNLCRGIPKGEASLQDYMKALGTALSPCSEESTLPDDHPEAPGEKVFVHKILCATGVK
jgi:hypothetical protein